LLIARQLVQRWVKEHPGLKLPVTFDNWYTQPAFCRFLDQELRLPYVGILASDDQVILKRGRLTLEELVGELRQEHLQAVKKGGKPVFHKIGITYKGEKEVYYSYCRTHRIHNFDKQRLVINFNQSDLSDSPSFYNSNRLIWQSVGITRIRRHRWPVEVYHQESKEEGLDKYQVREFRANRGILASSPSPIAYCVPPHTTKRSCTSFNVNSRWISMAAQHRSGVGPPKLRASGPWLASSVPD
jgi:hypothetical protein